MANQNKFTSLLFRFMMNFGINRFNLLSASKDFINAIVGWPEDEGQLDYDPNEEIQEIKWQIQNYPNFEDALLILELVFDCDNLDKDKITISRDEVIKIAVEKLKWPLERVMSGIDTLLDIKVDMVDDGKKTDYFFIHF